MCLLPSQAQPRTIQNKICSSELSRGQAHALAQVAQHGSCPFGGLSRAFCGERFHVFPLTGLNRCLVIAS